MTNHSQRLDTIRLHTLGLRHQAEALAQELALLELHSHPRFAHLYGNLVRIRAEADFVIAGTWTETSRDSLTSAISQACNPSGRT